AADTIDQRRMMRKLPAALAAGVLVLVGGALVASADTPDPCEDARSDRDYIACRADRHDAALADLKERLEALERKVDDLPAPADPAPSESPDPAPSESPDPAPSESPDPEPSDEPDPAPSESPDPEPSDEPSPSEGPSEFPNASNTGVPSGVALTDYTGPKTITSPTT